MSNNQFRKPFETAHFEFKATEKELGRLIEQRKQGEINLSEARTKLDAARRESESYSLTGNIADMKEANRIAQNMQQNEHVVKLLTNALMQIEQQVTDKKCRVLAQEAKCRDLQHKFFDAETTTVVGNFLVSHRAEIRQLVDLMGYDNLHTCLRVAGAAEGPTGLKIFFDNTLPNVAQLTFGEQSDWTSAPRTGIKGAIECEPVTSPLVSSADRSGIPPLSQDVDEIRAAFNRVAQAA